MNEKIELTLLPYNHRRMLWWIVGFALGIMVVCLAWLDAQERTNVVTHIVPYRKPDKNIPQA